MPIPLFKLPILVVMEVLKVSTVSELFTLSFLSRRTLQLIKLTTRSRNYSVGITHTDQMNQIVIQTTTADSLLKISLNPGITKSPPFARLGFPGMEIETMFLSSGHILSFWKSPGNGFNVITQHFLLVFQNLDVKVKVDTKIKTKVLLSELISANPNIRGLSYEDNRGEYSFEELKELVAHWKSVQIRCVEMDKWGTKQIFDDWMNCVGEIENLKCVPFGKPTLEELNVGVTRGRIEPFIFMHQVRRKNGMVGHVDSQITGFRLISGGAF